jgi:coenzyme F420-reducing hydrogenase delta subunit/Pyruvate/2-oxoacid:ferredoxin oxidoreductase delta subunit
MDVSSALLSAAELEPERRAAADPAFAALLDKGKCVRCLTCLRTCPYGAISLEESQPVIAADECRQCGHCVAECPCVAISLDAVAMPALLEPLGTDDNESGGKRAVRVLLMCCSRSAVPAFQEALSLDPALKERVSVVAVPCAGGLQVPHLHGAFLRGADGILVYTCHQGNCHAERGAALAKGRVLRTAAALETMGIGAQRLKIESVASNMYSKLIETTKEFCDDIERIGFLNL